MSEKTLKRYNIFFKLGGILCATGGLLVFFAAGDKLGIIIGIFGLYFTLFDARKMTSLYKNNKKRYLVKMPLKSIYLDFKG